MSIPLVSSGACMRKWSNEASTSSIHMNRNIDSRLLLKLVQNIGYFLHGFIVTSVSRTQNHKDPNGVLIDILRHQFRIKTVQALFADVQDPCLNLEIAGEFLQGDLSVGAHDDVWFRFVFSFLVSLLLPATLHGQTAKVNGFRGTGCGRADGCFALLHAPKVSDD